MRYLRPLAFALLLPALLAPLKGQTQAPAPNPIPPSIPLAADAPFTVAVNTNTIEGAPVYVADQGPAGAGFQVINGGVRNLANNGAHAATNAETQMLLVADANPKVRLLLTVAEGLYRLVAKRSAGITKAADLRGKRVAVPRNTSAHYFLVRTLADAGVQENEVTIVGGPTDQMAQAVVRGDADALAMWEPESQKLIEALGRDGIVFQDNRLYRELFSLYSTTDIMNDSRRRQELIAFVRALIAATAEVKVRPRQYFPLVARVVKLPEDVVARSWEHHAFPAAMPADMLDVLVQEEEWLARTQQRAPRPRARLAGFLDTSVLDEARRPARPRAPSTTGTAF